METICPHCEETIIIPENYNDQPVKCTACNNSLYWPSLEPVEPIPTCPKEPENYRPAKPKVTIYTDGFFAIVIGYIIIIITVLLLLNEELSSWAEFLFCFGLGVIIVCLGYLRKNTTSIAYYLELKYWEDNHKKH